MLVLLLLGIILSFVLSEDSFNLSGFIIVLLWAILFFIRSDKSRIGSSENCLKIKWVNWFREIVIQDSEIEKIILARLFVSIKRKGKKSAKLSLESLEKNEKTKIYEFLLEYSKQRNLVLERQLNL
jgi:hypothetical protein